ncbi:MAG: hypothetical protein ABFD90_18015 [Phycisphaerales bacterium]
MAIRTTPQAQTHQRRVFFRAVLLAALFAGGALGESSDYFVIEVVDRETGRGVPLVELRTTNSIRYFTDSNGIVAFLEPGLMDAEVFFFVESHGYEYPQDGFGYRGVRLRTTPGTTAVVKIDRINIAERLYRVTGQGIYRDSILVGCPVPLKNPALNGLVMGQDSVFTCLYRGRLFWMWGDTGRPSYPLGNFGMSGAVSDLPGRGGLDPAVGVNLEYFVGEDGFSRKMAPLKEPGLVWLDGLLTVPGRQGQERMIAKFARLAGLSEVLERGLMVFNDATNTFEPIVRPGLEFLPYRNTGHAFRVQVAGEPYYYFTAPSPMGARMRVPAQWDDIIDANRYEVLTALAPQDRSESRWVKFGDVLASQKTGKTAVIEALEAEAKGTNVYNVESGQAITPHNGTVYFNAHRGRWIGIFGQLFGESSALGEIWYAEADTPVGPWAYARKILTHNKYSLYNPKHHPLFDQDDGRTIYFEGTYTWTFSGSEERATPRYDYNQIMYRLNLSDPRLALPTPMYEIIEEDGSRTYLRGKAVAQAERWDDVESAAFYAIEPGRGSDHAITVYAQTQPDGRVRLSAGDPGAAATPLFVALPPSGQTTANPCIVPLYEYCHADSGRFRYSTRSQLDEPGWNRLEEPLCRVWKTPAGPLLLDRQARPADAL